MLTNKSIVEFNNKQLQKNKKLLEKKLDKKNVHERDVCELKTKNKKKMYELENNEKNNSKEMYTLLEKSKENSKNQSENREQILERRDSILSNHNTIQINKSKIFFGS